MSQDRSVSKVTGYVLDYHIPSTLGHTEPFIQRVLGIKRPESEANHSSHSTWSSRKG